jgi:acetyl esterase/lipase
MSLPLRETRSRRIMESTRRHSPPVSTVLATVDEFRRAEALDIMNDESTTTHPAITRRTALAGMSAGALGLTLAVPGHLAAAQDDPMASLQNVTDIVYSTVDGVDLIVDVLRPEDRPNPRPAVLIIHGGGLVQGSRWDLGEAALNLALAGYATFSIEYRLFVPGEKTNPWPAQLDDVQLAMRWIRSNAETYNVDPDRVGAFGFSSGGQLAGMLGTRDTRDEAAELADFSSKANCVVSMGGLFDFTFANAHPDSPETDAEMLGGSADALPDQEAYADFSPITFVDETSAPFLILQEGSPDIIPFEHPRRMVAALQDAGVQVSYSWFPEYTHETWFTWAPEAPEAMAFYARHLRPEE